MKSRTWSLLMMGFAVGAASAEEPRSDTLDQRLTRLNKIANKTESRAVRRGAIAAAPVELNGRIIEQNRNSDGLVTVVTSQGERGTYDPAAFRPLYDSRRDRTLFGLIPLLSGSWGIMFVKGDGWNLVRSSVGVTYTPHGNAPTPDALGSSTLILARNDTHVDGFGSSDSGSGHFEYQINSDQAKPEHHKPQTDPPHAIACQALAEEPQNSKTTPRKEPF